MANPAGPGAPDPRSLGEVAQDVVLDLGKLVAGLHAAGANPQETQFLTHMAEMMGQLGNALAQGPVGQHPVSPGAEAAGPQAPMGPQQPQAPAGPPHGSMLPTHSMAVPPSAQGAPGTGPAHGGINTAANHLKVAMQAAKAAAAAHAALGAQAAGQEEPAPGAGK